MSTKQQDNKHLEKNGFEALVEIHEALRKRNTRYLSRRDWQVLQNAFKAYTKSVGVVAN